jgi:RNA polymerase sigma-70 factor, ECF subfamily
MASAPVAWCPEKYRSVLLLWTRLHLPRSLWSREDPSDVVQQALTKAYVCREQFLGQTEGEWQAWLRQILANTLADAIRRFTRKGGDLERSLHAALEQSSCRLETMLRDDGPSPFQQAAQREQEVRRVGRLAEALEQLEPDQRSAVELKHLQGLPVSEIQNILGKTEAAVAGLLRRGLAELRRLLDDLTE